MPDAKQAPPRAIPSSNSGYLEVLSKTVFQSGLSYQVVESKWPGFLEAFEGFDPERVADFGPPDVERLLGNAGIIRNGRKIEGTIHNAQVVNALVAEHGSMQGWLKSLAHLHWPARKKAVAKPFKFLGPKGVYYYLWCVGDSVPPHDQEDTWTEPVPPGSPESLG